LIPALTRFNDAAGIQSTLGEAEVHLRAVRWVTHNHKDGSRADDIYFTKGEFVLNLLHMRGYDRRRKPRTRPRSANVAELKRYTSIVLTALQDVLDYKEREGDNRTKPDLWMDDAAYIAHIGVLASELKQLNGLLSNAESSRAARRSALSVNKHFDTFFAKFSSSFGTALGMGAASLLIGAVGGLAYHAGLGNAVVNQILSHFRSGH
jgi:hypothetical protein